MRGAGVFAPTPGATPPPTAHPHPTPPPLPLRHPYAPPSASPPRISFKRRQRQRRGENTCGPCTPETASQVEAPPPSSGVERARSAADRAGRREQPSRYVPPLRSHRMNPRGVGALLERSVEDPGDEVTGPPGICPHSTEENSLGNRSGRLRTVPGVESFRTSTKLHAGSPSPPLPLLLHNRWNPSRWKMNTLSALPRSAAGQPPGPAPPGRAPVGQLGEGVGEGQ